MNNDIFNALADPTRRKIIAMISRSPMTPTEVAAKFPMSRQAISRHLQLLSRCGVLTVRIDGREYLYNLRPEALAQVDHWLDPIRQRWSARFAPPDKH